MSRTGFFIVWLLGLGSAAGPPASEAMVRPLSIGAATDPVLPQHVTPEAAKAAARGLAWLRKMQAPDGGYATTQDGNAYPVSMTALAGMAFLASGSTPARGPDADHVKRVLDFVRRSARGSGLITAENEESGRPMYGHGFSLLFLATIHGMETERAERERLGPLIRRAIRMTDAGQSAYGGWTYYPGGGDEGSVTVTQIQALRAADFAGFTVPERTIRRAVRYLELCQNEDGGIRYSLATPGTGSNPPISAAAVATLYNAGQYESKMAERCLTYAIRNVNNSDLSGGHGFYTHLYAAQAFYQAGGKTWDGYFPAIQKSLVNRQNADGSWDGDGVGPVYGTSAALIILFLPYRLLPIYQR